MGLSDSPCSPASVMASLGRFEARPQNTGPRRFLYLLSPRAIPKHPGEPGNTPLLNSVRPSWLQLVIKVWPLPG